MVGIGIGREAVWVLFSVPVLFFVSKAREMGGWAGEVSCIIQDWPAIFRLNQVP